MNQEDKIYALMACAEEHQKLIDESIEEFKNANKYELSRLAEEQNKLHVEHRNVMKDLHDLAEKTGRHNFKRLGYMWFLQTLLASLLVVGLSLGGILWFIDYRSDDITEMNQTIKKLTKEGGEAEILLCNRSDGKSYPCVRVMKSWGGFGDDGDIFIIDPK